MQETSNNTEQSKLTVATFAPGTVSGQLYAYCTDSRFPNKKAFTRKTITYNAFKEFVETVMMVPNFEMWYMEVYKSEVFTKALTYYVNHITGRVPYAGLMASLKIAKQYKATTRTN